MHPKAAPCAGLGLASHDALGVTDFHGGIQPNRALIRVLPLVLSLGTVSMHRQVPGVERYDVECAGLENLSLFVTSCQIRSEEANCMLQQRHRRDCPPKSGRWPCSTSAAAAPPRLPPNPGAGRAAHQQQRHRRDCPPNPGAGRAAHQQQRHRRDCPPNPGAGRAAHQQQRHRRDCPRIRVLAQRHRRDCPRIRALAVQHISSSGTAATAPESGRWPCSTSAAVAPPRLPPESGALAVQHISSSGTAATAPRIRVLAVQHISSSGTAATAPRIRVLAVQHISSSGTAATAPRIRALAVQHISSSGTAATACPVRVSGGVFWRQRQRRDRLPRPGIRHGVLAAAATPRQPAASGHQAGCSGGSGNAATVSRVRVSGGVFWRQRQRRDRLPRPGIRRGVLAAAATPRPSPASGHRAGCSGGSGNAATVSRVRVSGGVFWRQRQRRDRLPRPGIGRGVLAAAATPRPSPASGHRAGCSGGSGNAATVSRVRASGGVFWRQRQRRDRLPRPGIGRGALAAAATPRQPAPSGHQVACTGDIGNAATACPRPGIRRGALAAAASTATACRVLAKAASTATACHVRASGGMHWRQRHRPRPPATSGRQVACTGGSGIDRDRLPRPGVRWHALAAAASTATACHVRASGGMHWRQRHRPRPPATSGRQVACTGGSGIDRDRLPRPGIRRIFWRLLV
ncbi:hypothetical protein L0F63_007477 [Massospora cicadina]|nr:hypothetical protein L0F63_007477 [Massospora cicadina]